MQRLLAFAWLVSVPLAACSSGGADASAASTAAVSSDVAAEQMNAIVATARGAADGVAPGGHCYTAVARYIDTTGYGKIPKQHGAAIGSLPSIPDAYGAYAHQFADYVNAGDHAAQLGLVALPLDNPYDAPAGAIVVVRAGTPGTSHPTAGDISIAAGNGVFYNDGTMGYHGRSSFPAGNDFVLGIYVPQGGAESCTEDADCNGGEPHSGRVCSNQRVCIDGCHSDADCADSQSCAHASPHWRCE